jgi:hypothetical protein
VSTTATTNAIEGRLSTSTLRMSCWSRRDVAGFFLRQARLLVIRFASGYSLYTHPSHSRGHSDEQLRYSSIARTVARLGPPWVINGHVRLREKASALPLKADILGAGKRCPLSAKSGHSENNGFSSLAPCEHRTSFSTGENADPCMCPNGQSFYDFVPAHRTLCRSALGALS